MIILKIAEIVYILIELFFVAKLDYKEKIIKNQSILRILYFGVLFLVLRVIFYKTPIFSEIRESIFGLLFAGGLFFFARLISKNSVGMGDVKIMLSMGFFFGLYSIIAILMLTLVTMSIYNITRLILKKTNLREEVAFAPYLLVGTVLALLLGF